MATIVGLFETRDAAMRAIEALRRQGYGDDDIGVVMGDAFESESKMEHEEMREGMGESAAVGAFGGGVIGGLSGLAIGLTGLIIPGVGPALVAGTLAGLVGGSAIGAATGGILGSLIELGVPHEQAWIYQAGIERSGVLVTVNVPEAHAGSVRTLLEQNGMRDIHENVGPEAERAKSPEPPIHHAWNDHPEATQADKEGRVLAGGAAGGVLGGIAGGFIAGPAGAAIGVGLGAATGGMAGGVSESGEEPARTDEPLAHDKATARTSDTSPGEDTRTTGS